MTVTNIIYHSYDLEKLKYNSPILPGVAFPELDDIVRRLFVDALALHEMDTVFGGPEKAGMALLFSGNEIQC